MNRHASSFRVAFTALLLAIGLPLLVLCAANVRYRQLQSRANPRWQAFAKTTGPREAAPANAESKPGGSPGVTAKLASHTKDLTGSVTGSSPIAMPVSNPEPSSTPSEQNPTTSARPRPIPDNRYAAATKSLASVPLPDDDLTPQTAARRAVVDVERRPQVIFHPVNAGKSESDSKSDQLQTQIAGMQRRLDQLAQVQVDKQISDFDRAATLLQKLQQAQQAPAAGQLIPAPAATSTPALAPVLPPAPTAADSPARRSPAVSGSGSSGREGTIKIIQGDGPDDDEKFSLQVHDAELTQVLDMLGQLAGVNILPSAGVEGRVSLNLQDVTVDRALEAILKSRGYVYERENDFIYVKSATEVAQFKLLNRKLVTKVYQPNYISASELSKLLTPILTKTIGQISVTSPSQIGIAKTPEAAGGDGLAQRDALLIQDYAEVIAEIDRVIIEMDVPPLQVIIEAKILHVALSDSMEFGVNFAMLNSSQKQLVTTGNGSTLNGAPGFPDAPHLVPPVGDFIANTAGLKYGFISGDVTGFIKALENIADTSLVAAPQIRVLNKQKAEMIIGSRLSYKTLAFNGTQTVENVQFLDSGTKLLFRPFISPDGLVRLEVHPERSSATINKDTGLPNQETTEVTTNIMVRDGTTVIIGGLISEETTESIDRVPFLGAIPMVGAAFRNKTEKTQRTELIVLITPRIVTEPEAAIEGECLRVETENRAANFRDNLSSINRQNLTRGHYERAEDYYTQGNLLKARQQVDAALRQNKGDLDSLRLKAQIEQATREQQSKAWKWPMGSRAADRAARR
ncbi:MAG: secretin and TonB N-terminal domain-containing protein [Planctomycetota bacterium]